MSFLPIADVNFRLIGGLRHNLIIVFVYFALVIGLSGVVYANSSPDERANVNAVFLSLITLVQGVFALLIAPSAVRKAVLRDFQSGMMESHRLTPLSGLSLIIGYLVGPALQAYMLFGAGLIIGGYFAGAHGYSMQITGIALAAWYASQFGLVVLSFFVISLVTLTAVATAGKTNLIGILIASGIFAGWFIVPLVPGLALLVGAMSAGVFANALGAGNPADDPTVLPWSFLIQILVGVVIVLAAARKIRRPERSAFSERLGILLLLFCGVALVVGNHYRTFLRMFFEVEYSEPIRAISSTVAFMLVALVPLTTAALMRVTADRADGLVRPGGIPFVRSSDMMPLLLTFLTISALLFLSTNAMLKRWLNAPFDVLGYSAAAVFLSFWIDYAWLYIVLALRGRGAYFALVLTWIVLRATPLVVDGASTMLRVLLGEHEELVWRYAGASPIGTMIMAYEGRPVLIGLAVQAVIAVGVTYLFLSVRRRLTRRGLLAAAATAI